MRRSHFAAFAPHCPVCARDHARASRLVLAQVAAEHAQSVQTGILLCPEPACQHEYPIIDGIPLIFPRLRQHLSERGIELLLRNDLDPLITSLFADALGPDSWFDTIRQTVSTYAWDGYADLDPTEGTAGARPGAGRRCLAALLDLVVTSPGAKRIIDVGCAAGRTSFDLAHVAPQSLVLGLDSNLALLRLAQRVLHQGVVQYDRRRIGIVYDQRRFDANLSGCERVDFWAADALALPLPADAADLAVALNLLDCVEQPSRLLAGLAEAVRPGGVILLATPFDWSTRATPMETWVGGHSQRGSGAGSGEAFLHQLLTPGAHEQSIADIRITARADTDWQTRLHDRATINYRTHLVALTRATSDA